MTESKPGLPNIRQSRFLRPPGVCGGDKGLDNARKRFYNWYIM